MEIGRTCLAQHQYAPALNYYQQSLALLQKKRRGPSDYETKKLYQTLALLNNNLADVCNKLNQPRLALPYAFNAVRQVQKFSSKLDWTLCEITLAETYSKLGKLDMALYHALNAHRLGAETNNLTFQIYNNSLLDTLYAQQGNYRLARRYLAENHVFEAQIRQQEQESRVAELQSRYDTQEKERSIKLLTQQNRIAELAALQQRTLRNAALVSALLLLAVAGLHNRYRLCQRTVQLLDAQNHEKELLLREKTLLLQEVHHRVKNNL